MRQASLALIAVIASGCSESGPASQRVQLASLSFDVPAEWQRVDSKQHGVTTAEWRPEDNDRKESLVVIRTELSTMGAGTRIDAVERLVVEAQKGLANAKVAKPTRVTTESGLVGAFTEVDFKPRGSKQSYHRVHVVLVEQTGEATTLVHVLYTARTPDPKLTSLNLIIDSIRKGEA